MKMFGSGISYLTIDLIGIWKTSDEHDFAEKRDSYLSTEKPPDAFYYHQLDYGRMKKIVQFIDRYLDSVTPENEMKMEIYFNQDQPAFIDDEVNTRLFNFYYCRVDSRIKKCTVDHTVLVQTPFPIMRKDGRQIKLNMQHCKSCGRRYLFINGLSESQHITDYDLEEVAVSEWKE